MDVLDAETDSADEASGGDCNLAPASVAPQGARRGVLHVYARDDDTQVKFISDGIAVTVGRLFEVAFFNYPSEASAIAAACATILNRTPGAAADPDGWHKIPNGARALPTLLAAARTTAWAATEPAEAVDDPINREGDQQARASHPTAIAAPARRQRWTHSRSAWFGFLIGQGWTAKKIAADELIRTTPGNVHRQAHRLGLSLSDAPQGQICVDLPPSTLAVIDRAASAAHLQRDAFIKRLLIRAARDPARYGMVVIST